jgi:hypothetical protein
LIFLMLALGLGSVPTKQGALGAICTKYQLGDPSARKYTRARARVLCGEKQARIRGCFPATMHPTGEWSMATPSARTEDGSNDTTMASSTLFIHAPSSPPRPPAAPMRTRTVRVRGKPVQWPPITL